MPVISELRKQRKEGLEIQANVGTQENLPSTFPQNKRTKGHVLILRLKATKDRARGGGTYSQS